LLSALTMWCDPRLLPRRKRSLANTEHVTKRSKRGDLTSGPLGLLSLGCLLRLVDLPSTSATVDADSLDRDGVVLPKARLETLELR